MLILLLLLQSTLSNPLSLTLEEQRFIEDHPVITLGGERDWEPMLLVSNGRIEGFDKDYLEEIESLTGLKFEIEAGNWSDIVRKAEKGEIDGLLYSSALPERRFFFNFTSPYIRFQVGLYGKINSPGIDGLADLKTKKVAIQLQDQFSSNFIDSLGVKAKVELASRQEVIQALLSGKIDYYFGALDLDYYLADKSIPGINLKYLVPDRTFNAVYSIRKDYPELISIINKAISRLPVTKSNALMRKWGFFPQSKIIVDKYVLANWIVVSLVVLIILSLWVATLIIQVKKRKRIESSLNTYKGNLQAQLENSAGLIYSLDKDFKVIIKNSNFEKFVLTLSGKSISIGDDFRDYMADSYRDKWVNRYQRALNGEKYSVEDLTQMTGSLKSYITYFNPIKDKGGQVHGIACCTEDVTEYTSLNRYMINLMETSFDYIFIKDLDRKFIIASQSLAEVNGLASWKDMVGKTDYDINAANAAEFEKDEIKVLEEGIYAINKEHSFQDKNGNTRWVQSTNEPIYNEKGSIIGLSGVSRDITESKKIDRFNAMLLSAIEATGEIIIFFDRDLRFLYLNKRAKELYGREDYLGRSLKEVFEARVYNYILENIEAKFIDQEVWRDEYDVFMPITGRRLTVNSAVVKVEDENGELICYANLARDITERNNLRDELEKVKLNDEKLRASQEAEELERNRIASELHDGIQQKLATATISLQSMGLSSLQGIIKLLSESIEEIRNTSHNLSLSFLRKDGLPQTMENEVHRLNSLQPTVFKFYDNLGVENSRFDVHIETNLYRIYQEATSNILKYAKATEVMIQLIVVGSQLTLNIEDDGVGFDLSGMGGAEGFGLMNMKNRALSIGAVFEIDSKHNEGTNVTIALNI